ncbi:MAG TPA: hypothetical protein VFO66_07580 [Gemmatimonadaceae bacterium]|nr:hypothetical protein [Gemmatimonadaceae bacterium]
MMRDSILRAVLLLCAAAVAHPVLAPVHAQAVPLRPSDTAFVVRHEGLIPENVAWDPVTGGFFIGDLLGRRVLHRDAGGRVREFAGPSVVRGAVVGMKPDSARQLLWVAVWSDSARMTPAEHRVVPRSTLLALDLVTAAVRHRYVPADSLRTHLFNDLVLTRDGEVLLTDSEAARVYRLASLDDSLRVLVQPESDRFSYPNGIALDSAERTVYVAHGEGVSAIDRETGRMRLLQPPAGSPLTGFDGLYRSGELFVAIRNGEPGRDAVVAFRVTPDGHVVAVSELERRHPAYHIPTTGAVVGRSLYYVANSQLDRMRAILAGGTPPLDPLIVLRLDIPRFVEDSPAPR